jgi:hypothetical protein
LDPRLSHWEAQEPSRDRKEVFRTTQLGSKQVSDSPAFKREREMVQATWSAHTETKTPEKQGARKGRKLAAHLHSQCDHVRSSQPGLLLTEPTQLAALAMPIWMFDLSSYDHLPFNDQLSSDGRGTGAEDLGIKLNSNFWLKILEFQEHIPGTPILFAIFITESEIPNHSNARVIEKH